MAELALQSVTALEGVLVPGRHGRSAGEPGVIVREIVGAGLAAVTARKGLGDALLVAARATFAVELPVAPRWAQGHGMAFIWSGPGQWLVWQHPAPADGMEVTLAAPFAGLAAIVEQSDARAILRVSGPRVRDALAKGLPIDLHPRAFQPGHTAITAAAHVSVQIWQLDDQPTYDLAVPRSFAANFWHWLESSAAEYGLLVLKGD